MSIECDYVEDVGECESVGDVLVKGELKERWTELNHVHINALPIYVQVFAKQEGRDALNGKGL